MAPSDRLNRDDPPKSRTIDLTARARGRCPTCGLTIDTNGAFCSPTCRVKAGKAGITAADVWYALTRQTTLSRKSLPSATPPPLRRLSYRQREVLKLRLGIGDGYEYSREEVAEIFKKPVEEIALLEQTALQHIAAGLGHRFEASSD